MRPSIVKRRGSRASDARNALAPDESLSLQVELSAPAYVYVINEDESGESYLLFPLPGLALSNPLPAGQRHRLPGMWNGESISWQVTTAGQQEHFPDRGEPGAVARV